MKQAILDAQKIAKEHNADVRIFDIRYATQGVPDEVTDDYTRFPAGSMEVLETGPLSGPPREYEVLHFPRWIAHQSIIQMEVAVRPVPTTRK